MAKYRITCAACGATEVASAPNPTCPRCKSAKVLASEVPIGRLEPKRQRVAAPATSEGPLETQPMPVSASAASEFLECESADPATLAKRLRLIGLQKAARDTCDLLHLGSGTGERICAALILAGICFGLFLVISKA